ncbi:MAG: hypothetical protein MUF34_25375 [Polyangiaceae bacterium]|nr:hypothetical protein [Polyangiaceae bacterium]
MDGYLVCFCLGASGLSLMALGGLSGRHAGRDNDVGSVSLPGAGGHAASGAAHAALGSGRAAGSGLGQAHAHEAMIGHGHAGGAALGHAQSNGAALGHGQALGGGVGRAQAASGGGVGHALNEGGAGGVFGPAALALRSARGGGRRAPNGTNAGRTIAARLLAWLSPRVFFSALVGFGATGLLARHYLAGAGLLVAALAGAYGFERFIVSPFWNFLMRFGSRPARTLDSALLEEARAVTNFDVRGEGLIAIELDGHFVQVLGTLRADQRGPGPRVRAGDRLVVEEVDAARNRCTVARG